MNVTEDEEFEDLERRLSVPGHEPAVRRGDCQHRWEQSEFGKRYWAPGTWQYTCRRCGKMNMIRMENT